MDTRTKILCPAEAGEAARRLRDSGRRIKAIAGYFDPLLADHARRVAATKDGSTALVAIVLEPPQPVLPIRARAELVAALAAVDLVVVPGEARLEDVLAALGACEVVRTEEADRQLSAGLVQHVRSRHTSI